MTEIPTWWLGVSATFFVLGTLAMIAIVALVFKLYQVVVEIQPQIKATAQRVEEVSKKVDDLADSVKGTVDDVGTRARGIVASAEKVAAKLALTPWVSNVLTAIRVARALQEMWNARDKGGSGAKALPKSTSHHSKTA